MSLTFSIRNLDKTLAEIKTFPQDVEKIINNEFKASATFMRDRAIQLAPLNEGDLRSKIQQFTAPLEFKVVSGSGHAAFIEFGTKGFAAAYVATLPPDWQSFAAAYKGDGTGSFQELLMKIVRWVRLKGIEAKAAYPIAKSILIHGIKQQPYLFPAFEEMKIELIRNLKAQLNAK